jgi:hypothetical protein
MFLLDLKRRLAENSAADNPQPIKSSLQRKIKNVNLALKELKYTLSLIRELLIEIKELVIIISMIAIFILGVIALIKNLH